MERVAKNRNELNSSGPDDLIDILANLKKLTSENIMLRAKYPDNPNKFATCEVELFATLDRLQVHGPDMNLSPKMVGLFRSLVDHENTDISAKAIIVLKELLHDKMSISDKFAHQLLDDEFMSLIIHNLDKYDQNKKEEVNAIEESINLIMKSLTEYSIRYEGHKYVVPLFKWIFRRMKMNEYKFSIYFLSMIDLVGVLLQDKQNSECFRGFGGIGILLDQIAYFRKNPPTTGSEKEYLYQVMLILGKELLDHEEPGPRQEFFEAEGVELTELVLREKNEGVTNTLMKYYMLLAFSNALTSSENYEKVVTDMCERFIEKLGLRVLFPIFQEPRLIVPKDMKRKDAKIVVKKIEEMTTGIILNLLKHCENIQYLQRITVKFADDNFAKFDKLIQLREKYHSIVNLKHKPDKKHKTDNQKDYDDEESINSKDYTDDELDGANFSLLTINYIFLILCHLGIEYETYDPKSGQKFSNRLERLLKSEKPELNDQIREHAKTHIRYLSNEADNERKSISFLVSKLEKFCSNFSISK